jgi:hypothetical protein
MSLRALNALTASNASREMIDRFGDGAAHIARKLAEVSDQVQDDLVTSAEAWRAIADAIERLSRKL